MKELLTKGIGHTEFKDSPVGRIPKEWEVFSLDELVSIPNGQVNPKIDPYASMKHIGSGNIISWSGKTVNLKTASEAGQISGKYLFSEQHVLYSKVRPNLAKVCFPRFKGVCSADIYPLKANHKVSPEYLFQYLLTEQFTNTATIVSERTGMPKINRQDLAAINVPIPPISEQTEYADFLSSIDLTLENQQLKMEQTTSLKKALMQDLLTGRVRVPLN